MHVDISRHNSNLASAFIFFLTDFSARSDHARTIRSDQCCLWIFLQHLANSNHVLHWDAFGDRADQSDSRISSFDDRIAGVWRRNKNHCCSRCRCLDSIVHRFENWQAVCVALATLSRSGPANHLSAIFQASFGMKCACGSGDALTEDTSIAIDEN